MPALRTLEALDRRTILARPVTGAHGQALALRTARTRRALGMESIAVAVGVLRYPNGKLLFTIETARQADIDCLRDPKSRNRYASAAAAFECDDAQTIAASKVHRATTRAARRRQKPQRSYAVSAIHVETLVELFLDLRVAEREHEVILRSTRWAGPS